MITIKEIIALAECGHLQNCMFYPLDSSDDIIDVSCGYVYLIKNKKERVLVTSLPQEEIERMEYYNNYSFYGQEIV